MENTKEYTGLSSQEATQLLLKFGHNIVEEKQLSHIVSFLQKFWAPIPWMLEVTLILQLCLHKFDQAIIISILLFFNSILSYVQETRANNALLFLRHHLAIQARVLRDGGWTLIPAQNLVPKDIIHLRMGDISPADIKIGNGSVLIDQSMLTGEAMPVECHANHLIYSGVIIKQGEATGEVTATGKQTYFGKSVELLQHTKTHSHLKELVFTIVKYLLTLDLIFALLVFFYAVLTNIPLTEIIPFVLILLIASIPVALPATFTLATALGALHLAMRGVLVTHLSAMEDASTMDILCVDKTGTITQNNLQLAKIIPISASSKEELLYFASLVSDDASQDPIDKAILNAAKVHVNGYPTLQLIKFIPFNPSTKRTEAYYSQPQGSLHVMKGASEIILELIENPPNFSKEIGNLSHKGYRVLAIAIGQKDQPTLFSLAGLIAFYDPPREDSKSIIKKIKKLGIRIIMLTGDSKETARTISSNVGLGTHVYPASISSQIIKEKITDFDIFAGLFPEDKFHLVQGLQRAGHIVGMTGDGVNDAPSLKQAEAGIAVDNAMDVAKAAASIVLTLPGLGGVLLAIETSRRIYQKMLTYILNKIIRSISVAVFLSLGVIFTGHLIITPLLVVLLLFANDFVTMSIATDNATFSKKPERWKIADLMMIGSIMSIYVTILLLAIFFFGKNYLHLSFPQLQTLAFISLVFMGQGNVYLVRERDHFWHSRPSSWMLSSTFFDILIVTMLSTQGILMAPINISLIATLLGSIIIYMITADYFKVRLFSRFNLR